MALIPLQPKAGIVTLGTGLLLSIASAAANNYIVLPIEGDGSFFASQGANVPKGHFHGTITYLDIPDPQSINPVIVGTVDGYGFQFTNVGGFMELFDAQVDPITGKFRSFGGTTIAAGSRSDFHPVGYEYQNHFTLQFDSTGHGSFDWTATYLNSPTDEVTDAAFATGTFGPVPDAGSTALLLGASTLGLCFLRRQGRAETQA